MSKWFRSKELAFALGTNISCARLGSVAGGFVMPVLFKINLGLFLPLFFAMWCCVFSWICGIALNIMDKKADAEEGINLDTLDPSEQVQFSHIKKFNSMFWVCSVSCILNYICIFVFLQDCQNFLLYTYSIPNQYESTLSLVLINY